MNNHSKRVPEILHGVVFPSRAKYTRWVTDVHREMKPGDTIVASCLNEAMAVRNWGRAKPRFWEMRQLKQQYGTYLIGRTR